jgi:hypothetical protein
MVMNVGDQRIMDPQENRQHDFQEIYWDIPWYQSMLGTVRPGETMKLSLCLLKNYIRRRPGSFSVIVLFTDQLGRYAEGQVGVRIWSTMDHVKTALPYGLR